ncbi:MAG: TonB-dependent receptor [Deltaproteobacteria bacterium]|nr:TonB-dependent receptor [Deltaproteobacteria bacterium]
MIALLLLAGAALAQTGSLSGVVFDVDGTPVPDARVWAGETEVRTDEWGVFRIDLLPGRVEVHVEAPGLPVAAVSEVPVAAGRTTEMLVTVGAGEPQVHLEAPSVEEAVAVVPAGPPGTVVGTVTDRSAGVPLADVRLFVRGAGAAATTAADGTGSLTLPAGTWEVTAIRAGYEAHTQTVRVVPGEARSLSFSLEKIGLVLSDLTITAPRITGGTASLLDERKEAAAVSDVLGAEQMTRAGDSDAAAALKRVTGLTVIGGRYVYVRGLGDRYSSTLLNDSALPSPEPEKRVVPLDLFPTALIEAIVVQKTFSPDRPGEFGGGVVEIRTRSIPETPVLSLGVSGTWVGGATLSDARVAPSGPTDWLGVGAGWRALPAEVAEASAEQPLKSKGIFSDLGYSPEELERYGEMIPNRWTHEARTLPPDLGLTASAGRRWKVGEAELGALGALVYSNAWNVEEGVRTVYAAGLDRLQVARRTAFVDTSNRVRVGGALSLGLDWRDVVRFSSTTLINRASQGTALRWTWDDPEGSSDTYNERIDWVEQQLAFEQLALDVDLGRVEAAARYALAFATRLEPDRREWTYLDTEEGLVLSQRGGWNDIQYQTLDDTTRDLRLDLAWHLPRVGHDTVIKVGGARASRDRASTVRRFSYGFKGTEGIDLTAPIDQVIVPSNIGAEEEGDPGYLQIEENTANSDDYTASQSLRGAYGMIDAAWTSRLRTLAGLRYEHSVQGVTTFELFDTSKEPVEATLESRDVLPAATVTIGLGNAADPDGMLLRAGYGRTLSRPEFRELTEVAYYDYRTGRSLYGNPDLERATIDNLDLRWEWYPRAGESLSVGAFFKYFDHPIESVVAVSAVSGSLGTFDNATSATNLGAELEFRQRLDALLPLLEDVYASSNVSLISSKVDLSDTEGNQTSEERPLQGQSPWVVNAQLSYENPDVRTSVSLLYNAFGPRIVEVGKSGIPDAYEEPVHRVDMVATQGFGPHWQVRLKVSNLLDWPSRQTVAGNVTEETRDGRSVGLSLTWTP